MKRLIILLFLVNAQFIYCQNPCNDEDLWINFDDSSCLSHLTIDTIVLEHNIWQIGIPHKTVFDSTICPTKVISTDTAYSYPINDTSVFIIRSIVTPGIFYDCRMFTGQYYVQTDSLKDYGKIEFSPDKGLTWIDILNDTAYSSCFIWYAKPILTGHSKTCKNFDALFGDLGSVFNLHLDDTILFRFSFISDSVSDNLGGLIYDNLHFFDFVEGMSEIHFKPIKSKIYPNPGIDIFTIEFENPLSDSFELSVYNIQSKLIFKRENIIDDKVLFDASLFKPDTYIYKLTDLKANKRCWGKFIKTK